MSVLPAGRASLRTDQADEQGNARLAFLRNRAWGFRPASRDGGSQGRSYSLSEVIPKSLASLLGELASGSWE
ncbi:MAG: hypothetical protein HOH25_15250 [Opitutae bacterium]|nr:hypothetical protein [Opitutae bacterium]